MIVVWLLSVLKSKWTYMILAIVGAYFAGLNDSNTAQELRVARETLRYSQESVRVAVDLEKKAKVQLADLQDLVAAVPLDSCTLTKEQSDALNRIR